MKRGEIIKSDGINGIVGVIVSSDVFDTLGEANKQFHELLDEVFKMDGFKYWRTTPKVEWDDELFPQKRRYIVCARLVVSPDKLDLEEASPESYTRPTVGWQPTDDVVFGIVPQYKIGESA